MSNNIILMPLFGQVFLTLVVWVVMYKARLDEIKEKRIHPQKLANASDTQILLVDSIRSANNFNNLFQVPILFYILSIVIYITQTGDNILLGVLTAFVISRYIHSYIQVTKNIVMNRFAVYAVGSAIMWAGWIILGSRLFLN